MVHNDLKYVKCRLTLGSLHLICNYLVCSMLYLMAGLQSCSPAATESKEKRDPHLGGERTVRHCYCGRILYRQ